jgi:N-acetylglucosamine-6-phosphate deacetylase
MHTSAFDLSPHADRPPRYALVNGRLVLPDRVVEGQALLVEEGRIAALAPQGEIGDQYPRLDVGGRLVTPGLIDIHTHGALGYTFNDAHEEAYAEIAQANLRYGVTSLLATTVSAPLTELEAALAMVERWMAHPRPGATIVGAHVEGPFFHPSQTGAQDPRALLTPDAGNVARLLAYASSIRILSFAPELPGADMLIRRLVERGIVPAAGHSAARDTDLLAAAALGLSHIIHIWSGQSTTVREGPWRRPGLLESTLTYDGFTVEMIADNRHLPETLMRLAYKCLGPDRLCAISDGSSGAGLPEGARFRMANLEYEVADGVGMLLDRSAFAGSTTLLGAMLPVLTQVVGIPLPEAVRMATLTPARVIGLQAAKGSLTPGKDADIAVFDDDFAVWAVALGGRWALVPAA